MRWVLIFTLLGCGACGDRRSFDERYEDTAREMQDRARNLDAELENDMVGNAAVAAETPNASDERDQ